MSLLTSLKEKSRSGISPVAAVLTVLIVTIMIAVTAFITGEFQLALNTSGLPSGAQNAIGNLFTSVYSDFGILPLIILVIIVVAVLAVIFLLVPRGQGGTGAMGGETLAYNPYQGVATLMSMTTQQLRRVFGFACFSVTVAP